MKAFAKFLETYLGLTWLNLSESLAQFSHTIAAQTRLDIEGEHLFRLNENFKNWEEVSFPKPLVLTEGVLVGMSYCLCMYIYYIYNTHLLLIYTK